MTEAVIVSAVRTPVGTSFKGTLRDTPAEDLATHVVKAALERSGLEADEIEDVILAEELAGGGDIARYAAVAAGLMRAGGQAVNRHCAGGLAAVGNAAAGIRTGMERAIIAGGTHSASMNPRLTWRIPGSDEVRHGFNPTFPFYEGADDDVTITTGWNPAKEVGLSREEIDAWAFRSHRRAIAAIDAGVFQEEIVPIEVTVGGERVLFSVDEHPRRDTSLEKLASLPPLHPEIEGFSTTAGNASGVNDAASALTLVSDDFAAERGLTPLAKVRAWGAAGVEPHRTGMAPVEVIRLVLKRAGLDIADVALWEINEAFASVPLAACKVLGIDDDVVNIHGGGCSIGHPISATGGRMLATLIFELRRRGGGIGAASMCAAGGQAGAVVIEV